MKQFLSDMLSSIAFITLYLMIGDIVMATFAAIGVGLVQVVYFRLRRRKIDPMQWMSLFLVIVFGSATLYFHDPRFIMVKPSVIHFAIGVVMLRRGWIGRYLPEIAVAHLSQRMVDAWGYAWAALMFALGVTNIVIALTCSPAIWGFFIAFGAMGAKVLMFAVHYWVFRRTARQSIAAANANARVDTGSVDAEGVAIRP